MDFEKISAFFSSLSPLKINNQLCSREITPKSSCNKCIEICPTKGLSFINGSLQVDKCIYCGQCVTICPNHVFRLEEEYLMEQCSLENTLIITCSPFQEKIKLKDKSRLININCLAQLYPELIIKLLANSQELVIFLDPTVCSNCLNFNLSTFMTKLKDFNLFIEKLHLINNLTDLKPYLDKNNKTYNEENQHNERRLFLKSIFASAKKLPQQVLDTTLNNLVIENDNYPQKQTSVKEKPLKKKYLYEVLKNKLKEVDLSKPLPYKGLQITKCNFCGACSKLCPTNALQIIREDNTKHLVFRPHLCTECNICKDICFFQEIDWSNQITIKDFIQKEPQNLVSATKKTCQSCEQDFWQVPDESTFCILCNS